MLGENSHSHARGEEIKLTGWHLFRRFFSPKRPAHRPGIQVLCHSWILPTSETSKLNSASLIGVSSGGHSWLPNQTSRTILKGQIPFKKNYQQHSSIKLESSLPPTKKIWVPSNDTPWKIHMESKNHPFRQENDLPNRHEDMFHVNLPGCTLWCSKLRFIDFSQLSTQLGAPVSSSKSLDINGIPPGVQLLAENMWNSGLPVGLWKSRGAHYVHFVPKMWFANQKISDSTHRSPVLESQWGWATNQGTKYDEFGARGDCHVTCSVQTNHYNLLCKDLALAKDLPASDITTPMWATKKHIKTPTPRVAVSQKNMKRLWLYDR